MNASTNRSFTVIFVLMSLLSRAPAYAEPAFSDCRNLFYRSFVPVPSLRQSGSQYSLCYQDFAVLYSGVSKTPIYSAEYLTREKLFAARGKRRTNRFYEEARLPESARSHLYDYQGSGFDRGHQSPAADRSSDIAMAESFSLSNVVPQAPEANRGTWAEDVERPTRQYAMRSLAGIYVITGPLFGKSPSTIGPSRVWVPSGTFKLVYDPARKRAWVYLVPNNNDARVNGVYSYSDLVRLTDMEFLPRGALQ